MSDPAPAIEFPDPERACTMKAGALLGRGNVAVPLRLPGTFALECVLRDASRERWLGREKIIAREVNPREFRVAVEAPTAKSRLIASGRRVSEGSAAVHLHLENPRNLLCGRFRYDLETVDGAEILRETSEIQGVDRRGTPVMGATWGINPFRFSGGLLANRKRRQGLAVTLAWAEALNRSGAGTAGNLSK